MLFVLETSWRHLVAMDFIQGYQSKLTFQIFISSSKIMKKSTLIFFALFLVFLQLETKSVIHFIQVTLLFVLKGL